MSDGLSPAATREAASAEASSTRRLVSASALMASGTMVSRVLGFGRLMLLVVLFGNGTRQAEMFTLANTVPTSVYILLAGGVLNTVLVPQIVRAIRGHADRGEAYTNRIMTAGIMVLGAITVALTFAAPLIIALYSAPGWKSPALAAQYRSMVVLAYFCMPQVFFYGLHVLAGQVLNARDRFGPMMWAPIANNLVAIAVLVSYWLLFGVGDPSRPFTTAQLLLLGLGSTLGIAMQAAVLVPFLRSSGYHFRPRFDFRHTGLGKTFRLAKWTLGFVLVTQAALVVVNRLASSATVGGSGAGLTAYSNAYAVWILPHSLITVSLATAMLPSASRLAAAGDLTGVREETLRTVRLAVTALLPASVAFVALGLPMARVAFGFGQGARDADYVGWALMALGVGLVPFTVQYLLLRAFYALEDNRSTFFLQVVIAAVNVVAAVAVVRLLASPAWVATGLAAAYSVAYLVGTAVSFAVLRRRLPGLPAGSLGRLCLRLLIAAAPAGAIAFWITFAFGLWSTSQLSRILGLAAAGLVALGIFLVLARAMHLREVDAIVRTILRRRPAGKSPGSEAAGSAAGTDRDPPGDSPSLEGSASPTIEAAQPAATPAPVYPPGGGPIENPDSMVTQAQADSAVNEDREVSALESTSPPRVEQSVLAPMVAAPEQHPAEDIPGGHIPGEAEASGGPAARTSVAASLPAGTVLGGRYRLEELLAEMPRTVTWRAFDQVLSRSVLVHLLPPGPGEVSELLEMARQASVATDARFLRVLDVVQSDDPDTGDYIVCEFANGQSLAAILSHGPLSGLEAAWVVREVGDALCGVHVADLFHQRINPETVVITPTGNVKILGLLLEQGLRAGDAEANPADEPLNGATPEETDVRDLGRLLYACLVARWPGGPAFGLPAAPLTGHRWMTPRQVRAGVSPSLDNLCDQILGDPPRHRAEPIRTAVGVVNALTKVLGPADASSDLERRLRQPIPRVRTRPPDVEPEHPSGQQPEAPVSPATTGASESLRTTMIRQPARPPAAIPPPPTRTRRRPLAWVLLAVLLALVVVASGVVTAIVLNRRSPASSAASGASASANPGSAGPVKLPVAGARDFDPQGQPSSENPGQVRLAIDGDPRTRWETMTYLGNPKLGGLKRGVGVIVDLGQPQPVRSARVALSGDGTDFELRVPKVDPASISTPPMSSDALWRVVGSRSGATGTTSVTVDGDVHTRFLLVYLTSLPREGRGYRGGVSEVEIFS